jgi:hypothetical protein
VLRYDLPMASVSSIPESLRAEVLRRSGEGESTRAIAAWLKEAHGGSGDHTVVARFLKGARRGREETSRAIVNEHIERTLPGDLAALDARVVGLVRVCERLQARIDPLLDEENLGGEEFAVLLDLLLKATDGVRKLIDTKLKYSGAAPSKGHTIGDLLGLALAPVIMLPTEDVIH